MQVDLDSQGPAEPQALSEVTNLINPVATPESRVLVASALAGVGGVGKTSLVLTLLPPTETAIGADAVYGTSGRSAARLRLGIPC
ncbi:hypothetical protein GCM10009551_013620 [Nocardiopsis tropica]